jgi:chemotaxis protein MotB
MVGTLGALIAVGCGPSKSEFAAAQRDAEQNQKKYQDEAEKSAALEKKVNSLEQQLAQANQASAQLQMEKGQAEAKSAQYQELARSMQSQIASGEVELSELRGRMTVRLKDRVLFSSGSTTLNKQGKAALDAVADAFKNLQGKNVVVAGYTDDVPIGSKTGFADNWALSTARAVTVVRYLQSRGVPPDMLGALGFSQYRPVVPNDSSKNRSQNRRIEIALTSGEAPPVVETPK